MFRQGASRHSTRAAHLRLALCPSPKAAPSLGTLPSVQALGIHPSTLQSGTLIVLFSLHHYHGTWQLFPCRPLLDGACQGPPVVFPASQVPPRDLGASPESQVHDSLHSCGLTSSTCLLSRGAEAATCSDDCPALSCGGNAPQGLSSASTVTSGSLTSWGLSFPHVLRFDDPASGWVKSLLTT